MSDRKIPQLPARRPIGPARRPADPCADRHVSRPVRDAKGRELGYLCLGCGRMIHRRGGHELLELCALSYLTRQDVELGRACRRRLEAILRRERRKAGVDEEETDDGA